MSHERWYYFLSIEKDFIRTLDFVELHPANSTSFSNEYAKLLLLIGSEVDVVAKMVCANAAPTQNPQNVVDYRTILTAHFNGFHTVEIDVPRYARKIQPWLSWGATPPSSPSWWTAYNKVKHERDVNFADANQENTIFTLCGWIALLLYLFKDEQHLQPYPDLLNYGFPRYLVTEGGPRPPGA
jgi:hypothetical protein